MVVVTATQVSDGVDIAVGSEGVPPLIMEGAIRAMAQSTINAMRAGPPCDCEHCNAMIGRLEAVIAAAHGGGLAVDAGAAPKGAIH